MLNLDINKVNLYNDNLLNLDFTLSHIIIIEKDKESKIMCILVLVNNSENKNMIKSVYNICPICKESERFRINDYSKVIYNCKKLDI